MILAAAQTIRFDFKLEIGAVKTDFESRRNWMTPPTDIGYGLRVTIRS